MQQVRRPSGFGRALGLHVSGGRSRSACAEAPDPWRAMDPRLGPHAAREREMSDTPLDLDDHAMWLGRPILDLTREELRAVLAYKLIELRYCYLAMDRYDASVVAERMKDVPAPY